MPPAALRNQKSELPNDKTLQAAHRWACDALRAFAWAHWAGPPERFRQLRRLGVPEAVANKTAFTLDFPVPEDDPPVLREVLPDAFFERFGLKIQRLAQPPLSEQPLSQTLSQSQPHTLAPGVAMPDAADPALPAQPLPSGQEQPPPAGPNAPTPVATTDLPAGQSTPLIAFHLRIGRAVLKWR